MAAKWMQQDAMVHGGDGRRGAVLRHVRRCLGGHLAVALPALALAAPPPQPFVLPPPDAPASAYGPGMRSRHGHPDADDLAGLAERLREQGQLPAALQLSQRVRTYAPRNRQAIQTEVTTLSDLGAADLAYRLARKHPSMFPPADMQRLRVDKAAADIRDALAERKRRENRFRYARRDDPLLAVLPELDANLKALPQGSDAYRRTQRDRLLVLRKLGRMHAAIAAYRQLKSEHAMLPPYVKRAAADAFESAQQPARAAALYREIVAANPAADVDIFVSLYYALVDAEDYAAARRVLDRIVRDTPVWLHPGKGPRHPNWERLDVDQLRVMDAAYRNHDATAQRRARSLYRRAPYNVDLINTYATILRWRGWPRRAHRVTQLAATYAPRAKATRVNQAEDARDMEHYRRWHALIAPLAREFPDDSSIARSLAEWQDRRHASASAQLTVGHSSGNNAVAGNRDRQLQLRANAPWGAGGWRVYGLQDYRWSAYDAGNASFDRVGVGAEWRWDRRHVWAVVSDDRFTGRHAGVQAGWSQWLDDCWQYRVSADTYAADTPLRAERAGLRGRSLQAQVTWRASESRSASLTAGLLDIGDGNHRESLSADFSQRIQASAHHQTRLTLHLDDMHDTQPGGAYFNPPDLRSAGVAVRHDWITWRHYQRSLTQNFQVAVADEWQSGYGGATGIDLQYGQTWQLSRTWSLNYGIGWGSHVYDGGREHRVFGTVGFSGVF